MAATGRDPGRALVAVPPAAQVVFHVVPLQSGIEDPGLDWRRFGFRELQGVFGCDGDETPSRRRSGFEDPVFDWLLSNSESQDAR
jgi:hypothetical protein